ncbi:amidohydrolase family protein [Tepidamorphus sp. 3E244]|uniref:amidohydrolase family protein n=1 Tax=Tepidamorphus sp. 3E244 TaxID=3385498 RepID=UPI0038FCF7B2
MSTIYLMPTLIRNARLHGRDGTVDIAIADGIIREIAPRIETSAPGLDAGGNLLFSGFAESHIHLDKACILDYAVNETGTLEGAIAAVSAAKAAFSAEDIYARGRKVIEKALVQGTTAMRTHVEIDPGIGLIGFSAIRQLKQDFAWAMDIDICVFPQEGLINNPGTDELLVRALELGADLLGGCPYTDSDPDGQIEWLFKTAREFDVDLDFHLDFDLDTSWRHLDKVAAEAIRHGWQGRVAIGHVSKLSMLPEKELVETAAILRDAGIAVTVLPATDLFLMGRDHDHGIPRGVAPAHRLDAAGVACTLATNNVLNPFTPFGDCSLARMANLFANVSQLGTSEDLERCFAFVSDVPRGLMHRDSAIEVGKPADLVLVDAGSRADAVAEIAQPLWGMKAGQMTFQRPLPVIFRADETDD